MTRPSKKKFILSGITSTRMKRRPIMPSRSPLHGFASSRPSADSGSRPDIEVGSGPDSGAGSPAPARVPAPDGAPAPAERVLSDDPHAASNGTQSITAASA